jgi:heptaprenylglyceryl phosphate synthase
VRAAVPSPTPLFVGGGIRSPREAEAARRAGADFVVVGTVLEQAGSGDLAAFARAVRS